MSIKDISKRMEKYLKLKKNSLDSQEYQWMLQIVRIVQTLEKSDVKLTNEGRNFLAQNAHFFEKDSRLKKAILSL